MNEEATDLLDELSPHIAPGDPTQIEEWEATKQVARIAKARNVRGLPHAQIAARMDVPPQTVAQIERTMVGRSQLDRRLRRGGRCGTRGPFRSP